LLLLHQYLSNQKAQKSLGPRLEHLSKIIQENMHHLPDVNPPLCLVHGDFRATNILLHQVDHEWKVSGLIDWEFAFSGPCIYDIAKFIRYDERVTEAFNEAFIEGFCSGGGVLPENWKTQAKLIDLINLCSVLALDETSEKKEQRTLKQIDYTLLEIQALQ